MRLTRITAAAVLMLACVGGASAQAFPNRPIRMVVPFPPGGTVDIVARVVAQPMSESLNQQIVVENRAGGSGSIGAGFVSKAPPDGYTVLLTASVLLGTPLLMSSIPYDVQKDFTPISNLGSVPVMLVVNPNVPVTSFVEFIRFVRANPGKHAFATSSIGSAGHLASEMIKADGKLDMLVIGYKGTAPAIIDLVGGQVTAMVDAMPSAYPQVRSGKLRAIAVGTAKRLPFLQELPTIQESGVAGFERFDMGSWYGIWGPPGMPKDVVERLSAEAAKAIKSKLAEERLASQSFLPVGSTPAEFAAYVASETDKYKRIVADAKLKKE